MVFFPMGNRPRGAYVYFYRLKDAQLLGFIRNTILAQHGERLQGHRVTDPVEEYNKILVKMRFIIFEGGLGDRGLA